MRMRKILATGAVLAFAASSSALLASVSPDGWIRTAEWSGLYLSTDCGTTGNATCEGCGPGGDQFDGAGHFDTDWSGGVQLFVPGEDLDGVFTLGGDPGPADFRAGSVVFNLADFGDGDVVDHNGVLGTEGVNTDNVYGISQTVIDCAADVRVRICTASDDSVILFVDDVQIFARSVCRGTAGGCAEATFIDLPAGEHVISTITHEGGGGFGFRCRMEDANGPVNEDHEVISFLGPPTADTDPVGGVTTVDTAPFLAPGTEIRAKSFTILFPFDNPGGAAPGAFNLSNTVWLAPHVIEDEDPKVGNRWNDIERPILSDVAFGGSKIWLSTTALAGNFPTDDFNPNNGIVDFNNLTDRLSAAAMIDPAIRQDNAGGVATLYINNLTEAPLPVNVEVGSDDSVVLYLNRQLIHRNNIPRGSAPGQDVVPVVLSPGVNKLTSLTFEGGGGFNFRARIRLPDGRLWNDLFSVGTDLVDLIVPDDGGDYRNASTPDTFALNDRQLTLAEFGCPNSEVTVTLQGNGSDLPGFGGAQTTFDFNQDMNMDLSDAVALLNHLFLGGDGPPCDDNNVADAGNIQLLDVNADGGADLSDSVYVLGFLFLGGPAPVQGPCQTIAGCPNLGGCEEDGGAGEAPELSSEIVLRESISINADASLLNITAEGANVIENRAANGLNDFGFFRRYVHLGPYTGSGCDNGGDNDIDWLTDGAGTTELNFEPADGDTVATDFAVARSAGIGENGGRNPGGVPTATYAEDPDDTVNYNDVYGSDVNDIMMYSFAYFRILEDLTGVQAQIASDDALTLLIGELGSDPTLVLNPRDCRGFGGANSVQNTSAPFDLVAGEYKAIIKVFEGGGGHGFRFRLTHDGAPLVDSSKIQVGFGPGDYDDTDRTTSFDIEWVSDAAGLNEGVSYTLAYDGAATVNVSGSLSGATTGILRDSPGINFAPQTGPVGDFENSHTIGSADAGGSLSEAGGTYTMEFSGADFWDGGDHGYFAYVKQTGDFEATVELTSRTDPAGGRWGKHGVMARYTCDQGSKYSMASTHVSGAQEYDLPRHQNRRDHLTNGTSMDHRIQPGLTIGAGMDETIGLNSDNYVGGQPGWLRLGRRGKVFYSYHSTSGEPGTWHLAGSDTHVNAPDTVLLGVAGTSHDGANLASVDFTGWTVTKPVVPALTADPVGDVVADDFNEGTLADRGAIVNVGSGPYTPELTDGALLVTDTQNSEATAIWFDVEPGLENPLADGHIVEFDFFYNRGGAGGDRADGFNFAVVEGDFETAAPGKVGGGGGAAGYDTGDSNALPPGAPRHRGYAIEIDNWDGGVGSNDRGPGNPHYHLGVNYNNDNQSAQNTWEMGFTGANDGTATSLPPVSGATNADAGAHVIIHYLPEADSDLAQIRVWLSDNKAAEGDEWFEPKLVLDTVAPKLRGPAFVGAAGGTGGANANQALDNFSVQSANPVAP